MKVLGHSVDRSNQNYLFENNLLLLLLLPILVFDVQQAHAIVKVTYVWSYSVHKWTTISKSFKSGLHRPTLKVQKVYPEGTTTATTKHTVTYSFSKCIGFLNGIIQQWRTDPLFRKKT